MQRIGWKQKIGLHRPKLDGLIKEQLEKHGVPVSGNTLIEYILAMISNGRDREQVAQALHAFVGESSAAFTTWAFSTIEQTIGEPIGSSTESSNPPPESVREKSPDRPQRSTPVEESNEVRASTSSLASTSTTRPSNPDRRDDVAYIPSVVTRVSNPTSRSSSRNSNSGGGYQRPNRPPRDEHDHRGEAPPARSHRGRGSRNYQPENGASDSGDFAESESEQRRIASIPSVFVEPGSRQLILSATRESAASTEKRKRQQQHNANLIIAEPHPSFTVTLSGVPRLAGGNDNPTPAPAFNDNFNVYSNGNDVVEAPRPRNVISPLLVTLDDADFDDEDEMDADNSVPHHRPQHHRHTQQRQPPRSMRGRARKKPNHSSDPVPRRPVKCRFWPACELGDQCAFVHPSEPCAYWPACTAGDDCLFLHPSVPCRYGLSCSRVGCAFNHPPPLAAAAVAPVSVPCRNGESCTRADCMFVHPRTWIRPGSGQA